MAHANTEYPQYDGQPLDVPPADETMSRAFAALADDIEAQYAADEQAAKAEDAEDAQEAQR